VPGQVYPFKPIKNSLPAARAWHITDSLARPLANKLSTAFDHPSSSKTVPEQEAFCGWILAKSPPGRVHTRRRIDVATLFKLSFRQTSVRIRYADLQPICELVSGPITVAVHPP